MRTGAWSSEPASTSQQSRRIRLLLNTYTTHQLAVINANVIKLPLSMPGYFKTADVGHRHLLWQFGLPTALHLAFWCYLRSKLPPSQLWAAKHSDQTTPQPCRPSSAAPYLLRPQRCLPGVLGSAWAQHRAPGPPSAVRPCSCCRPAGRPGDARLVGRHCRPALNKITVTTERKIKVSGKIILTKCQWVSGESVTNKTSQGNLTAPRLPSQVL